MPGKAKLLARGPTTCALCGCNVSDAAQHEAGKRHQSNRFYGVDEVIHSLRDLQIPRRPAHPGGPPRAPERLRPAEVAERHVEVARAARARVLPIVVRHSGVHLHARVCRVFDPEAICEASIRSEKEPAWAEIDGLGAAQVFEDAGATTLLCLAEGLRRMQLTAAVEVPRPADEVQQIATSAALDVLAATLAAARLPVRLELALDGALGQRRLAALFVRSMEASLLSATSLVQLRLTARGCALRGTDVAELKAAARLGWQRRARAFLMGGHPRLGAASCVRLLPGALLQTIVELAEPEGATQLEVALDTAAPPPPAAGPAVFGADLAAIAALVG